MTTRDFDAMLAEKAGTRPTFKVANQEFTLRSKLPYSKWHRMLDVMRADETSAHDANVQFFKTVLIKADRERFLALLSDQDEENDADLDDATTLGVDQADAIIDWAMEYYTGKLQSNTNGSSPGANGTGPQRNVVSLSSRTATG